MQKQNNKKRGFITLLTEFSTPIHIYIFWKSRKCKGRYCAKNWAEVM